MPPGKRPQSNAMLYTVIAFVGLFILATVAAIIFYVKFEDQRTIAENAQSKLEELATPSEQRKGFGKIVGSKTSRESYLGKMVTYLDNVVSVIVGTVPQETSAEVKANTVDMEVQKTRKRLAQEHPDILSTDPNTAGLIPIITKLKNSLNNTINAELALEEQLRELHNRFDDTSKTNAETIQKLSAEKDKYRQQVNDIKKRYDELEALLNKTTTQQVQDLRTQLDGARAQGKRLYNELQKTQAQLKMTQTKMELALGKIEAIEGAPDSNAPAYKPDGRIIFIDNQIVHLNIGTDDRVYQGLAFAVYDKTIPIPKDGKGKAEIEVFDVGKNIAAARIIRSQIRRPIVLDDIIANLIWDRDRTNTFVVAGSFDLNGDGDIDYDGAEKIEALIKKWGGKVSDSVSIDTDFLVLGTPPQAVRKPTRQEIENDPMAMQKYETSLQKLAQYRQIEGKARDLRIPVFNTERFLYFIGYKGQAARPGAF